VKLDVRGLLLNAFNYPQYTAGQIADVGFTPVANTVHANTVASSPLFNDPSRAFPSNARLIQLVCRLSFWAKPHGRLPLISRLSPVARRAGRRATAVLRSASR
jgi:hypothetical protein